MGLESFSPNGEYVDIDSIPEKDIIWLAGFIDGEGYLDIYIQDYVSATLELCQTYSEKNEKVLDEISEQHNLGYTSYSKTNNTVEWRLQDKQHIMQLLKRVKPYLRIKDDEAEVLIEALEKLNEMNTASDEGLAIGQQYKDMLREMKSDKTAEKPNGEA